MKRGCILSPTLFSLYINDIVDKFNTSCDAAVLKDRKISCLLFADDLVLLSNSSQGLQKMLDKLYSFCQKWNLKLNVNKTKVMIFNKSGKILKGFHFLYNNQYIHQATEYKYLGIYFKASGSFTHAINYLSKKASKAMFCVRKMLFSEKLNVPSHIKLFDTCVKPILLYCSEVWGLKSIIKVNQSLESKYKDFLPDKLQIKNAKFILGVSKKASNMAVLGELGLFPLAISAIKLTIGFWDHLIKLDENSIAKRAYEGNLLLKNSFCDLLKCLMSKLGFSHIWENQGTFSINRLISSINKKLEEQYIQFWKLSLFDDSSNPNGNKLRLYRKLKLDYKIETYLLANNDKSYTASFTKIRISNSNLKIEEGRYNKTPLHNRLCPLCNIEVEDEFHFLMSCPCLDNPRNVFLKKITDIVPSFSDMSINDKFMFILKDKDVDLCQVCIDGLYEMYNLSTSLRK